MPGETFTVDTHLFRELGELLVGRDSTALVELIKNAYDADATEVIVHGEHLEDARRGKIVVADDGIGMNEEQFREGFLRIASRLKEQRDRRSPIYKRRYTGAKGIGRLAAHKLARKLRIHSIVSPDTGGSDLGPVDAQIDWRIIEKQNTLEEIRDTDAVIVRREKRAQRAQCGTQLELEVLRRKWTSAERARFFSEVQTFEPPAQLVKLNPKILGSGVSIQKTLLFDEPTVRDSASTDPGFKVKLSGDFEAGEEYWQALAESAQWILELDAQRGKRVKVNLVLTRSGKSEFPDAQRRQFTITHPTPETGPFFQSRILIREGAGGSHVSQRWMQRSAGIRVFMEGFRVLPYGAPDDDWLGLDADYKKRPRTLPFLNEHASLVHGPDAEPNPDDSEEGLVFISNSSYFGAVFLTAASADSLKMLINREGFDQSKELETLTQLIRLAVYLSVRVRAAAKFKSREERRQERSEKRNPPSTTEVATSRLQLRQAVEVTVERATELALEARRLAATGNFALAQRRITEAAAGFVEGAEIRERLMSEGAMLRVLASVGTQMSAFVHEINGLLGTASAIESAIDRLIRNSNIPPSVRREMSSVALIVGDLRRSVERQASYLTDVVSADARRRRSRQKLSERFKAAARLVQNICDRRGIVVQNDIPTDLKSPPMFPAEVTVVFSNLLSNAVKAAGKGGRVRATGRALGDGDVIVRVENTGRSVDAKKGERWFRPFESTTIRATDPVLGQGMGMGLTLTRNLLEEYGASICFVEPRSGFATALEVRFP